MNMNDIKANWLQLKGNIKAEYGELTDNDLLEIEGKYDILVGKLQERYDIPLEEAQKRANKVLVVGNNTEPNASEDSHVQGEGDYEAGRRFQDAQHEFAKKHRDEDSK